MIINRQQGLDLVDRGAAEITGYEYDHHFHGPNIPGAWIILEYRDGRRDRFEGTGVDVLKYLDDWTADYYAQGVAA